MKTILATITTTILLISIISLSTAQTTGEAEPGLYDDTDEHSFETCVAQGNAIMESYPRQCMDKEGNIHVEIIDGKIKEETQKEKHERMLQQFGETGEFTRIGFYFAEGIDKKEANKILATYDLELRKTRQCQSSGTANSGPGAIAIGDETKGTTGGPAPQDPIAGDAPAQIEGTEDINVLGPTEENTQDADVREVTHNTDETCETKEEWYKVVPTDKEYFGTVNVPKGKARELADRIVSSETGVVWAEPQSDATIGGIDIYNSAEGKTLDKKDDTKENEQGFFKGIWNWMKGIFS